MSADELESAPPFVTFSNFSKIPEPKRKIMIAKALLSSGKTDYGTPWAFFNPLDEEFHFNLDVCASGKNTKCGDWINTRTNGLLVPWDGVCWMNPPYGGVSTRQWVQKAWDEKKRGVTTVCLIPSRTDTRAWGIFYDHEKHKMRDRRDEVRFIKGRIKFMGEKDPAPFPSAIIVLRGKK